MVSGEESSIVPQLLKGDNYKIWRNFMRDYLMAQDLWDIVDGTEAKPEPTLPEFKSWRVKNSKALHAIKISCTQTILPIIIALDSAKDAWDLLLNKHKAQVEHDAGCPSNQELLNHVWGLPLYKAVESGDWKNAKSIIKAHSEKITLSVCFFGNTVLHWAAINGQLQLIEKLIKRMNPEQLEAKNVEGNTALASAAIVGVTEIAQALLRKNPKLVCIENHMQIIPVVQAADCKHKDMTRYLYSVTPKEELSPERGKWGATLLTATISADMYDIALDLLDHHPRLATAVDVYGRSAILELPLRPSAFSNGNQYSFWQRWIYSCIHVQPTWNLDNIDKDLGESDERQVQQRHIINHVLDPLLGLVRHLLEVFAIDPLLRLGRYLLEVFGMKQIYEMFQPLN